MLTFIIAVLFFSFFYHPELTQCRAVLTSSLIGFIPSFLSSPHLPSFLRRCFPTECGVVTPLLGWCSNSRPCDCAQESEDCITACGERPQEWTEGGAAGKREIKSRERSQQMRGKRRGESDDRRWVYRCKKWRASQEGMEMRHVLFMWKYVRAKRRWGVRAGGNAVGRLQRGDGPSRVTVEVKVSLGGDANQIFRSSLLFSSLLTDGSRAEFTGCYCPTGASPDAKCCEMPCVVVRLLTALQSLRYRCVKCLKH